MTNARQYWIDRAAQTFIVLAAITVWEGFIRSHSELAFFFGQPSRIMVHLVSKTLDGSLVRDASVTTTEIALGFIGGNLLGASLGLGLWYSQVAFRLSRPFIVALGSAPVFALAPVLIVWFGTGLLSKVMI